jgi:hypothetical protein
MAPGIGQKMLTLFSTARVDDNGNITKDGTGRLMSDDDKRKWISDRGLNEFIIGNMNNAEMPGLSGLVTLATPQKTLGEQVGSIGDYIPQFLGGKNKLFDPNEPFQWRDVATLGVLGGPLAYRAIPAAFRGVGNVLRAGSDATIRGAGAKNLSKLGITSDSKTIKTAAQKTVNKWQSDYNKHLKKNGGKGIKNNPIAANLKKKLTQNAKKVATNKNAIKGVSGIWQKLLTKYGSRTALLRAVGSKIGYKKGASVIARLIGGGLLTGSGLGTAIGVGLTAKTIYDLYSIGSDMLSD